MYTEKGGKYFCYTRLYLDASFQAAISPNGNVTPYSNQRQASATKGKNGKLVILIVIYRICVEKWLKTFIMMHQ